MYIFETSRLKLREFTLADTAFIIELVNSPGWLKYIGDRDVRHEEQAKKYLENGPLKSYALHGHGLYMVELKDTNKPIGMCGILKRETLDHPDLGFAFLPQFSGQGYAYEVAEGTIDYAKHKLKMSVISAITLPDNTRSIRLLEKLGFTFKRNFYNTGSSDKLLLYESPGKR